MRSPYVKGMLHGIPIALGYLSVSFGLGIKAAQLGIPVWAAVLTSLTNLTSAGQAAGLDIIAAAGTLVEMVMTQLVINLRYSMMGFSLSQKLDGTFTTSRRMLTSFGITDEVYAVAVSQPGQLTASYMLGLISLPVVGWTLGTLLGGVAGQLLPASVTAAMGLVLYGMFLAIILPPARKERSVLLVVLLAAAFSVVCKYLLSFISGGFAVIISALLAAVIGAWLFPVKEEVAE